MKLAEAAKAEISRVRRPNWANETSYLRMDLVGNGSRGPWLHLYDRGTQQAIGEPTPQTVLCINEDADDFVEYTGELDQADTCGEKG